MRKEHNFHSFIKKRHLEFGGNNYVSDSGKCFIFQRFVAMVAALIALVATPNLAFSQGMMDGRERVVTPDEIGRAIGNNLEHPYLYFSSDEVPELRERIASDPVLKEIFKTMLAESNRLLFTPVEKDAPVQNKNPRYTGNWDYHRYIDNAWENALQLAFVYQMTGETKYAEKAFEFAELVCDVPNWNDRAHMFPTIYSRIMPYNVPDDQYVFSFDLYTGHTATSLATVYDWIYDYMDIRQRDRIRGALMEKAVTLVHGNWDYHWWAWSIRCNWLTHCASGVGMASLALLTENPELVDVVAESYNRIWLTFNEIGQDGGWQEGTGYAFNNPQWAVLYGVPLKRMTGGKYTILNNPRMRDQGVSFFIWTLLPPNQKVNFGDTGSRMTRSSSIFNTFAEEMQSPEAAWYAKEYCGDSRNSFWDIIFPPTTVEPAEPEMKSRHYRTVDYVVMRSSFTDLETVTLVSKAGRHTDPHHGHLDCGDWGVHWRGESYIRGIGNIPYDEKCFDDVRWTYPQAGSQGQNVIFVNGERQIPGKWRGQPMDESIGGDVLEYRYGDAREYVLMDGTNAYPQKELKGWRRHLILDKPVVTVVLDEIKSAKGALIESRIHPIIESANRGAQTQSRRQSTGNDNLMGNVTIPDDNAYLLIKGRSGMMALIAVADDPVSYVPDSHAYLPIQKEARLRKIPFVDTELTTSGTETTISTIVLPVANEAEAREVSQSVNRTVDRDGNLTLSFTAKNQTHEYRYERSDDGLVLDR